MAGRPTKYTTARADLFIAALQLGGTFRAASAAAGVSEDTSARWRADNAAFAERIKDAIELRELAWLGSIRKAQQSGHWTAAAWLLERTNPTVYGRKMKIEPVASPGPELQPADFQVTDEQIVIQMRAATHRLLADFAAGKVAPGENAIETLSKLLTSAQRAITTTRTVSGRKVGEPSTRGEVTQTKPRRLMLRIVDGPRPEETVTHDDPLVDAGNAADLDLDETADVDGNGESAG